MLLTMPEKSKIERVFYHYSFWECYRNGMWRKLESGEERDMLSLAVEFTGDDEAYGAAMLRVVNEWPVTCKHHLSDLGLNRRAFVGHAAACLAHGLPEYITRQAWALLTDDQRVRANRRADIAIEAWENAHLRRTDAQTELGF